MARHVLEELIVEIGFDFDDRDVRKFLNGLDESKKAARGFLNGVKTAAIGVGIALGAIGAAGVAVARDVIAVGGRFENLQVQLEALEGSAEAGRKAMDWITEFAKKTPLELDQVVSAYAKLRSFGMDPTNGSLQTLMDTMAATGKGAEALDGIILALGQAWTKSRLMGDDALQLLGRGIPVYDILAEKLGKTTAEIQKMQSAGELGREAIELLIEGLDERFSGAAEKFAQTKEGIESNLSDIFTLFRKRIADAGFFDAFKQQLQAFLDEVNRLDESGELDRIAERISGALIEGLDKAVEIISNISVDDVISAFQTMVSLGESLVAIIGAIANAAGWIIDTVQGAAGFLGIDASDGQAILAVIAAILAFLWPIPALILATIAVIKDLWELFTSGDSVIGSFIESAKIAFSTLWTQIETGLATVGNAIVNTITGAFDNAVAAVKGVWSAFMAWITAQWNQVWGTINGAIDSVKGWFGFGGSKPDTSGAGVQGPGSGTGIQGTPTPSQQGGLQIGVNEGAFANAGIMDRVGVAPGSIASQGPVNQNSNNQTTNTANVTITQNITEAQAPDAAARATAKATSDAAFQSAGTTAPEAAY